MRSSNAYTRAVISILALPLLIALGWLLYQQVLAWILPKPEWIVSHADWQVGRCIDAADLPSYWVAHPEPEQIEAAAITSDEAREIADRIVSRHRWAFGEGFYVYSLGPQAIYAAFANGEQRLVWFRVVITERGQADEFGEAAAAYVDAMTGEPLALIMGVTVDDLLFSCRYDEEATSRALRQRVLPVGVVGICLLFAWVAFVIRRAVVTRRDV